MTTRVKTTAQRQADLRLRRSEAGLSEVRGLYAKTKDHAKIKAYAKSLQKVEATVRKSLVVTRNKR